MKTNSKRMSFVPTEEQWDRCEKLPYRFNRGEALRAKLDEILKEQGV